MQSVQSERYSVGTLYCTQLGLEAGLTENPFEMKMTQISWLAELTRNCCNVSDPSLHQGNPTLSNFGP